MTFAEVVKSVRYQLRLSQTQLAKALNVNYTTINRWENGKVIPSNLAQKSFYDFCENNFIDIQAIYDDKPNDTINKNQ